MSNVGKGPDVEEDEVVDAGGRGGGGGGDERSRREAILSDRDKAVEYYEDTGTRQNIQDLLNVMYFEV